MLTEEISRHSKLLHNSFTNFIGRPLLETSGAEEELAKALYQAPFVVLSHDTQEDPVFNYANQTAQKLWELDWEQFTRLPSRLSAEPVAVAERHAMLEEARRNGFISNYQGVRISRTGKRFLIKKAILWNVYDGQGIYRGQAAMFRDWEFL